MSRGKRVKIAWIVYLVLCIGMGVFQFADMRASLTSQPDPLWHVVFYLVIYPLLSVILGVICSGTKRFWAAPFAMFALAALIAAATLSLWFSLDGPALLMALPSFAGGWVGIAIGRLIAAIRREKSAW